MGEVFPLIDGTDSIDIFGADAKGVGRAGPVRPDRPGGLLPGEGRLDPGGQEGLPRLRRPGRVPGVRAGQRRALRHLGRAVRARAPAAEEERRLTADATRLPPSA